MAFVPAKLVLRVTISAKMTSVSVQSDNYNVIPLYKHSTLQGVRETVLPVLIIR